MTNPVSNIVNTVATGGASTAPFIPVITNRVPTVNDINYPPTKRWIDTTNDNEYFLLGFTSTAGIVQANWINLSNPEGSFVEFLATNSGGNVGPTISGVINVVGDGTTITGVGNPSTNTITLSAISSGILETLTGDSGGPIAPVSGNITLTGGTTGLTLAGTTGTLTLTGILKLANGGTSASLTASDGGIFYSTATVGAILAGTATARQMLQSGASTTPAWSTTTWPATTSINTILYSSSASVIGQITAADNGVLISGTTGIPSWLANSGTPGYVLTANSSSPPSWQAVSASGAVTTIDGDSGSATPTSGVITFTASGIGMSFTGSGSTVTLAGTLDLANGGTNANLTASNGGIFYSTASTGAILAGTATARQMLQSGSATTPAWSTTTWPATTTANQILYSSSTSVIGQITTANNGVLITGTTGIPSFLAAGTTGQVLIATTSNPASWGTLSSIAVTSISGTANQITASASTGAVTLSFPNGISVGTTYAATTPPTQGLLFAGQLLCGETSSLAQIGLGGASLTAGTTQYGFHCEQTVQSAVTNTYIGYRTTLNTQAASFVLTNLYHHLAGQGTIGAGSSVTTQAGFFASSSLTGATNNYGFYSNIGAASNQWNFYANGLGNNFFAGNVGCGITNPIYPLQVSSATTGPQIVAGFGNTDNGGTTSEARVVFLEGGSYYQGIGGFYNSGSPYLSFSASSSANTWSPKMYVTSSGGVGINDSAPGTTLSVVGNAQIGFSSGTTGLTNGLIVSGHLSQGTVLTYSSLQAVANTVYTHDEVSGHALQLYSSSTQASSSMTLCQGCDATNTLCYIQSIQAGVNVAPLVLNGRGGIGYVFIGGGITSGTCPLTVTTSALYSQAVTGVTVTGAAVLIDSTSGKLGTVASSRKVKENIQPLDRSIMGLRPVKFNYIGHQNESYGFIAEEVEEEFPELVVYDKEGKVSSVEYHEMPALLLAEIQRLNKRLEALEKRWH